MHAQGVTVVYLSTQGVTFVYLSTQGVTFVQGMFIDYPRIYGAFWMPLLVVDNILKPEVYHKVT